MLHCYGERQVVVAPVFEDLPSLTIPMSEHPSGPGPSTAQIKATSGGGLDFDDKMDELRAIFPSKSSGQLRKALDASGGDVQQAIIEGQSKGFTD